MQTSTEKCMKSSRNTSASTFRNRNKFLFKNSSEIRFLWESMIWPHDLTHKKSITYRFLFIPLKNQSTRRITTVREQTHLNKLNKIPETIVWLMFIIHCHWRLLAVTFLLFGQRRKSTTKKGGIQYFILNEKGWEAKIRVL